MSLEGLHPLDDRKIRTLAESLCDIAAGRLLTREGLAPLLDEIFVCAFPRNTLADVEGVLDRAEPR